MTYEVCIYYETWAGESPYLIHPYENKKTAMEVVRRLRRRYRRKGLKRVYKRPYGHLVEAWALSKDDDEDHYIEMYPLN